MEQFAWIDIITIGLILILAIKGVINGLIKEVFGLVGIVGGIYFATRYANEAGVWINTNLFTFGNESSMFLIGFLSVLIGFWLSAIILGALFSKLLRLSGLGFLDKLLGFLVGGAKIFIIFSIIFVAVSHVEFIQDKLNRYIKNSFMYPYLIKTGTYIVDIKSDKLPSFATPKDEKPTINLDAKPKDEVKIVQDINDTINKTSNTIIAKDINISDTNQTKE